MVSCRCDHISPVLKDLQWLSVSHQWSLRQPRWSGSVSKVLLQPISVTSAYLWQPPQVDSIRYLQWLELCCFHVPGQQLDSTVSLLMDRLLGTVYHLHYGHQTCTVTVHLQVGTEYVFRLKCLAPQMHFYVILAPDKNNLTDWLGISAMSISSSFCILVLPPLISSKINLVFYKIQENACNFMELPIRPNCSD